MLLPTNTNPGQICAPMGGVTRRWELWLVDAIIRKCDQNKETGNSMMWPMMGCDWLWVSELIVVATRNNFFACWSQYNCVLVLSRIRSFDVAQRWVCFNDTFVAQILQCHLVFGGTGTVQPTLTERQCAEILVDRIQQAFGRLQAQWYIRRLEGFHVMRAFHVLVNETATGRTECFDGIELVFLHACCFTTWHIQRVEEA